jgi:hypothetical protein
MTDISYEIYGNTIDIGLSYSGMSLIMTPKNNSHSFELNRVDAYSLIIVLNKFLEESNDE